jgi:hypothetical protein
MENIHKRVVNGNNEDVTSILNLRMLHEPRDMGVRAARAF